MSEESDVQERTEKIETPKNAKFKVYWYDRPENYNRDNRLKIKNDVAKKYGVSSDNVKVIFRHAQVDGNGDKIELDNAHIDNVLDENYQKELFKEWVKREEKNVDVDRLMKLDDTINSKIDFDLDKELNKTWRIKSLELNNFLSFGEGNKISYDNIRGLTVVTSDPENQGGKSTFCLDAIKFLLFGTTTKTDKNEQIFNDYSDNNKLSVKGEVDLDAELLFIERKMSKSVSNSGNVNINNKLDLYKKDVDGKYHKLNEEDAKQTQQKISDFIGKEKDFESVVIANDKTLENLIDSTPTENGKLLNRFIGTEVFFEKEKKAREEYNAFAKNMLSNTYDVVNLKEEINDHQEKINKCNGLLEEKNKQLDGVKKELDNNNNRRDELFSQKRPIDESIQNVDKDKLEREIQKIEKDGKELRDKKKGVDDKLKELGDIEFDEDRFNELSASIAEKEQEVRSNNNEQERLQKLVDDLEQGQICPTCKRPLEDVDHSNEIKKNKDEIKRLEESNKNINEGLKLLNKEYSELSKTKEKVDEKNKLELEQSRLKAEIDSLRAEYKEKDALRERFKENSENITKNKNIQSEIDKVKSQIEIKEGEKDQLNKNIESLKNEIDTHKENIDHKNGLIDKIQKEKEVERLYKVYIEMLGKKGVRKIVLQSVLPTINSELNKLLDEVCNFSINLDINHKDEVQFYINKDGSERLLKSASGLERVGSSLALRCVLGRVSNLPTPNFVVFDEIFGKVGESNMSRMKDLLDKVTDMYDIVFFITHSSLVKDWADNIISITSDGKISRLDLNKEQ